MGSIVVDTILTRAGTLIQDATNVRWPLTELLGWFNDGQREVVVYKPEANSQNASVLLTAGGTKQTIPTNGVELLDVVRNMGADGLTPGNPVTVVSRQVLDTQIPGWHSAVNALGYIQHYVFDPRDPTHFYTYPQAPATPWYAELVYSAAPVDAVLGGVISLPDIYANALLDYVLYRAYSKDSTFASNSALAVAHYQAFTATITGKGSVEAANNPNRIGAAAGNPNIPVKAV